MRIVVTGAAGFLGSHLAERFLVDGHAVIGVDNYVTGSPKNVEYLRAFDSFDMVEHDVTVPLYLNQEIDGILHFASPASPVDYLELPIQTLKVGSLGTATVRNEPFMICIDPSPGMPGEGFEEVSPG
ncbi:NAD-dependent epimerase/dehydratase family protein [Gemmatimonadales bacterium]|nr:NAD-dependent epimerase/dehydratase family protein [Gemmatimonadales bacterium]